LEAELQRNASSTLGRWFVPTIWKRDPGAARAKRDSGLFRDDDHLGSVRIREFERMYKLGV